MRSALLAVLLSLPSGAWADFGPGAKGTTAAGFLKLGAGARAEGLGQAYAAAADEASALYWNPAALTRVERRSATFMHLAFVESSAFDYGAYAHNLGAARGAFGVGVQYASAGGIPQTDEAGAETGRFTPNDLAFSLGYARLLQTGGPLAVFDGASVGLSAKLVRSQIVATAQTYAFDLGALSKPYVDGRLRVAGVIRNLGGALRFEEESAELPLEVRTGGSYRFSKPWLLALDAAFPRDGGPYVAAGAEYRWAAGDAWALIPRLGLNTRTLGDVDGFSGVSFGLGWAAGKLGFDYAFLPVGGVALTHRFSMTLAF